MAHGKGNSSFGYTSQMRHTLQKAWKDDRRGLIKVVAAWIIFGAIILVFAFLGLTPHQAGLTTGGSAAVVNGDIVSLAEFTQTVEQMGKEPRFAQIQQLGGDFAQQMIRQQALRALVDQKLLEQNIGKTGVYTPDGQVRDAISEIPAFQDQGKFSPTRYVGYLQATRQDAGEFESRVRQQIATNRLAKTFSSALRPISIEHEIVEKIEGKKANAEVVTIPTENLIIPESIPASEVKGFLAKTDSEGRVKAYYDLHKADYSEPEKAKVRHILIKAVRSDLKAVEAARTEAKALVEKLKAGSDFAKMAKEHSGDPGSAKNGGLIDYFAHGSMVPEFEAYAFSGKPGEVSDPIQTDYGFHIIRVEDRKPESTRELGDVREEIAETLIAQEKSREAVSQLEKLLADGDSVGVQNFVSQHHLSWKETGAFSITAETLPVVGAGGDAVTTAFQLSASAPLAKTLIRQGNQAYILRYKAVPSEVTKVAQNGKPSKTAAGEGKNKDFEKESQAARRADEVFGRWIDVLRKASKISISPDIAKSSGFSQAD